MFCKRDRQGAHAAGTADDQQRFVRPGILNVQALKQPFPCGERGQRQCGSGIPAKACRFVSHNTRINQLIRGITARTGNITRVPHFVARFEAADACSHRFDDTAGIPAENAWRLQAVFNKTRMHFGIDRIDGNGFYFHQQIVFTGLWHRLGDLNKSCGIFRINGNGFNRHDQLLNGMRFVEASLLSGHAHDKMDNQERSVRMG